MLLGIPGRRLFLAAAYLVVALAVCVLVSGAETNPDQTTRSSQSSISREPNSNNIWVLKRLLYQFPRTFSFFTVIELSMFITSFGAVESEPVISSSSSWALRPDDLPKSDEYSPFCMGTPSTRDSHTNTSHSGISVGLSVTSHYSVITLVSVYL